ncbi:MAG: DUF63 family protein, partial [Candidatus Nanohaloarchaea archaeon]
LQKYEIKFTPKKAIYSIPFIILGGSLRFIEDAGAIPFKYRIILITPLIYFLIALIYIPTLIYSEKLEKTTNYKSNKIILTTGSIILLPTLLLISHIYLQSTINLYYISTTLVITMILQGMFYLLVKGNYYDKLKYHLTAFSQLFGGVASMMAVYIGYTQKQILAQISTRILGPPGILIVKSLFLAAVLAVLKDGEDETIEAFLLLGIITVGLATGIRVFLRAGIGI